MRQNTDLFPHSFPGTQLMWFYQLEASLSEMEAYITEKPVKLSTANCHVDYCRS